MNRTCHANVCNILLLNIFRSVTPGVTTQLNFHKYLQGWLAESHPLGDGPERDVTGLRSKGSVTCHNRANAQSTRPPSVTVSRPPPSPWSVPTSHPR
jgi:hypothetical protein